MITATVLAVFVTPLFSVLISRAFPSRKATGTRDGHADAPAAHGIPAG